jgi:hypothetical protein
MHSGKIDHHIDRGRGEYTSYSDSVECFSRSEEREVGAVLPREPRVTRHGARVLGKEWLPSWRGLMHDMYKVRTHSDTAHSPRVLVGIRSVRSTRQ